MIQYLFFVWLLILLCLFSIGLSHVLVTKFYLQIFTNQSLILIPEQQIFWFGWKPENAIEKYSVVQIMHLICVAASPLVNISDFFLLL